MSQAASLISPWLLWWPPAESHYSIYDSSVVGYVSHVHCIVLLYSVWNIITTTIKNICSVEMNFCVVRELRMMPYDEHRGIIHIYNLSNSTRFFRYESKWGIKYSRENSTQVLLSQIQR